MKFAPGFSKAVQAFLSVLLLPPACAASDGNDLSQPVMLVATSRLVGSVYEETVVVTAPLPQGGHIGWLKTSM